VFDVTVAVSGSLHEDVINLKTIERCFFDTKLFIIPCLNKVDML
jgi:hypothetical protein